MGLWSRRDETGTIIDEIVIKQHRSPWKLAQTEPAGSDTGQLAKLGIVESAVFNVGLQAKERRLIASPETEQKVAVIDRCPHILHLRRYKHHATYRKCRQYLLHAGHMGTCNHLALSPHDYSLWQIYICLSRTMKPSTSFYVSLDYLLFSLRH